MPGPCNVIPALAIAFALLIQSAPAQPDTTAGKLDAFLQQRQYRLYPGITLEQSDLAHEGLRRGYNGNFLGALQIYATMERLERIDSLPPLSQLLIVATGVLLLERGDFGAPQEAEQIHAAVEAAGEEGNYLCRRALQRHRNHGTYLLIQGGIQGFLATRKIQTRPTRALQEGFQALKQLERCIKVDPRIKDAHMGAGIFDCSVSNAPLFVRGGLKILGRSANFHQGIRSLRISAYEGQYTSVASQLYLIQFLSPYDTSSRREKRVMLAELRKTFPRNPMYLFLEQDEALCFYPDSFYSGNARQVEKALRYFKPQGYAGKRYLQLVRLQASLLHPKQEGSLEDADSSLDLREWEYYPIFVAGMRRKREYAEEPARRDPDLLPAEVLDGYRDRCLYLIKHSPMTSNAKRYQSWRVRDAFRFDSKAPGTYADDLGD